jgi:hypothetical protein
MDTNRQRTYQTILDLHHAGKPAARQLIATILNEKLSVVDEAVKRLREDGLVRTVVPGILEPVAQFPPDRPISRTTLPDGRTKIEMDDFLIELTPHEAQVLGKMLMGDAMQLSYWYAEREQGAQLVRLETQLRELTRRFAQQQHRLSLHARTRSQPDLFNDDEPRPGRRRTITA